jgi:hypothetical protein
MRLSFASGATLCEVVADHAQEFPGRAAVVFPAGPGRCEDDVLTYVELAGRAWALAGWLRSRYQGHAGDAPFPPVGMP